MKQAHKRVKLLLFLFKIIRFDRFVRLLTCNLSFSLMFWKNVISNDLTI